MNEYETYPDFAVYLFSQSINYLCHILTQKKYLTRFYEKEKKKHKIIGKSMVRFTSERKGGGGNSKETSTREGV